MGVNCIGNFIICSLRIILVGNKRKKCRKESSLFETLNWLKLYTPDSYRMHSYETTYTVCLNYYVFGRCKIYVL